MKNLWRATRNTVFSLQFWMGILVGSIGFGMIVAFILMGPGPAEKFQFLGAAFGAFVAAMTSIGVVEYAARMDQGRGKILLKALMTARNGLAVYVAKVDKPGEGAGAIRAVVLALRNAEGIARELQTKVDGAAAAVIYLSNISSALDGLERRALNGELGTDAGLQDMKAVEASIRFALGQLGADHAAILLPPVVNRSV